MGKVKFGDVVKEVKVNIDRSHNPYEFYVAGDHMDSEDLTIRRKGRFATDDVGPAFIRLFKPGQVLYGSRRTYLKKVAVADFEGITANTTFVLETKDGNVFLQKLLPFLMLSDSFTEWSVKKSKGSTNPYVLFSDLADYEFNLPSLEEQRKLADLLWSAYDLKESYKRLLAASDEMAKSRFVEMFGTEQNSRYPVLNITEVAKDIFAGGDVPKDFTKTPDVAHQIPIYSNGIEKDGLYGFASVPRVTSPCLTVSARGTIGSIFIRTQPFVPIVRLVVVIPNTDKVNLVFLSFALRGRFASKTGSSIPQLPVPLVKAAKMVLPPLELQNEFAAFIEQLDKSKVTLQKSIDNLDAVIKNLLNKTFTEGAK